MPNLLSSPIAEFDLRYHQRPSEVLFRLIVSNHDARLRKLRPIHGKLGQTGSIAKRKVAAEAGEVVGRWLVSKGAIFRFAGGAWWVLRSARWILKKRRRAHGPIPRFDAVKFHGSSGFIHLRLTPAPTGIRSSPSNEGMA